MKIKFSLKSITLTEVQNVIAWILEKIPKDFRQLKETIKTKLEDYIETVNHESWYLCKKYYLAGLNDGINLKEEIK